MYIIYMPKYLPKLTNELYIKYFKTIVIVETSIFSLFYVSKKTPLGLIKVCCICICI